MQHPIRNMGRYRNSAYPIGTTGERRQRKLPRIVPPAVSCSSANNQAAVLPDKIEIAFCFDRPMVSPACVAIASLAKATRSHVHIHACVGNDQATAGILRTVLRELELNFDVHSGAPERGHELPPISPYDERSTAAYQRIFLADLLTGIDRVLYLDVDVLVRRDLRRLWRTDLNGMPFGAVPDPWWVADPARRPLFPAGYFNSGVLLLDLAAWRRQGLTDRVIDHIRAWRAGRQIGLASGDAAASPPKIWGFQNEMNAALVGRWRALAPEWNYSIYHGDQLAPALCATAQEMAQAHDDPAIVHFMGPEKPWSAPFARLTRYHEEYQSFRNSLEKVQAAAWPKPYATRSEGRRLRRLLAMKLVARAQAKGVRHAAVAGHPLDAAEIIAVSRSADIDITCVVSKSRKDFLAIDGRDVVSIDEALDRGNTTFILANHAPDFAEAIAAKADLQGILPDFVVVQPERVKTRGTQGPTAIRIEASSSCQLRCPSCPTTTGETDAAIGRGYLDPAEFRTFLTRNAHIERIELSNYGEALLNPELVAILDIARRRNVAITFANGVNFNHVRHEVLEAMVRCRVPSLTVSIDGASQDSYAQYRKGGDFARVMQNLLQLILIRRREASELPKLTWQFVIFDHNKHEIDKARAMAATLGMQFATKLSWDDEQAPSGGNTADAAPLTRTDYRDATGEMYLHQICEQLWDSPQINWDGRILGCCRNFWKEFGGNAFKDALPAALNGEAIRYARRMLMGRAEARAGIACTTCEIYLWRQSNDRWIDRPSRRP
jgi:lipopolysaccharide biosynthesis glycosyltransferase/MoaA/NifB/PqqE/SkfB family radical SAM enzyme